MSVVADTIRNLKTVLPAEVTLVAVSKTKPIELIEEAYAAGQVVFGENRVQELVPKYEALPKDIQWHLIGHLQTNKVKYIAPFVHLIHSIDSEKLLAEVNRQAERCGRVIDVLLQMFIAQEETKFGFDAAEVNVLLAHISDYPHVRVTGLMGMASNTEDQDQVRMEFRGLADLFHTLKTKYPTLPFQTLSMGMSSDWKIAVEEGSTLIRVGSALFGHR